jgi:hypothetical protein
MSNLANTLDKYLPDISSIPKSVIAFEPFVLRYDFVSQNADVAITIPVPFRLVVDEITMTSVMRWKGGTSLPLVQSYPYLKLAYRNLSNNLLVQTFPTNSNAGGVPVVEPNSCFVSTTQKLQFNRLPFIAGLNTSFFFTTNNAYWTANLQADFTCDITINARQIF